jgi:hypothetical protein
VVGVRDSEPALKQISIHNFKNARSLAPRLRS